MTDVTDMIFSAIPSGGFKVGEVSVLVVKARPKSSVGGFTAYFYPSAQRFGERFEHGDKLD
jgi:hypothetical protein